MPDARSAGGDTVLQLQSFLENSAARLPDKVALVCGDRRLVPKLVEFLEAFPKTGSGKIDKKVLAARGA